MPLLIDLLDWLHQDVLALFLINDALLSTSTSTAAGREKLDDTPLSLLSYNYYAVSILARFPPRELGVADGGKDDGGDDNDDAHGASATVHDLGI